MPSREELIAIALRNQRHLALETPVADIEQLPDDLLTALVDCGNSEHYRLHGFLVLLRTMTRYVYAGQRVDACASHLLCGEPMVAIRCPSTGKTFSMQEMQSCRKVSRTSIASVADAEDWWFASVEGNGVTLASKLQERGFPASAGSPNFVAVRPVFIV